MLEPELHLRTDSEVENRVPIARLRALGELLETQFSALVTAGQLPKSLPSYMLGPSIVHDRLMFRIETGTTCSSKRGKRDLWDCKICPSSVAMRLQVSTMPRAQLRLHVAGHMMAGHGGHHPCGLCGRETCTVALENDKVKTHCPFRTNSSFKKLYDAHSKEQGDRAQAIMALGEVAGKAPFAWLNEQGKHWPVANIPLECPSCSKVFWKYNMVAHFLEEHTLDSPVANDRT